MVFPHGWQDEFPTTSLHHGLSLSCVCHFFSPLFCTLARSHQKFVFCIWNQTVFTPRRMECSQTSQTEWIVVQDRQADLHSPES